MTDIPKKCPKCGSEALPRSPFDYPSLGYTRIHFLCDSYGYTEEPFRLATRSDFCCEREERNLVARERNEALARMCQAIGRLSTIAEDCEAWLNNQCDETACEFIKSVRDYARKAVQE